MSRASNSLLISDVTATPIKLKYSSSYSNTTICDSGIYAQSGLNGPVTITGSVPQRTLRYYSARHLFYSNFLTGSYAFTTSSADNFLQSTAASGTFEGNTTLSASADIRYFPTESLSKIKIINIPRSKFGEKTSRKSFTLNSVDGTSYNLADDGNGNVYDTLNGIHVGNIIYAEGFIIITNQDYYCVMDGGPFTFPKYYTFDVSDNPKQFNPISDAQPDCAPIDTTTLTLITSSTHLFPSYTQNTAGTIVLNESDVLTSRVGVYRDYYTVKSTYCASSDKLPLDIEIIDVALYGLSAIEIVPTPTPTPTTSVTPTPTTTTTVPLPTPTTTTTAPLPTPTSTTTTTAPLPTPTPTTTTTAPLPTPTPTTTTTAPLPTPTPTLTISAGPSSCGTMGTFTYSSGPLNNQTTTDTSETINCSTGTAGTTIYTGTLTTTTSNCVVNLFAFSGTGGSTTQGTCDITGGPSGPYALDTGLVGPSGGANNTVNVTITTPGTYNVTLRGFFNTSSNPPTTANNVRLYF